MRDADATDLRAPDGFSRAAALTLLHWVYTDDLRLGKTQPPSSGDDSARGGGGGRGGAGGGECIGSGGGAELLQAASEVLHLSQYYGCARLAAMCEAQLAAALTEPLQVSGPSVGALFLEGGCVPRLMEAFASPS
eukprot:359966-Chlamydomonas_euryale.AAC.2